MKEEIKKALQNGKNYIEEVYNNLGISIHISNDEIHIGNSLNKNYDKEKTICSQNLIITKSDIENYWLDPNLIFN